LKGIKKLTIFESLESWHGGNPGLLSNISSVIDINLQKSDIWVLLGKGFVLWGDRSARSAPIGKEINYDFSSDFADDLSVLFQVGNNFYH